MSEAPTPGAPAMARPVTNARVARWVSDIFIWLGVLGGLATGAALFADNVVWTFSIGFGFGIFLQLMAVALVLRLLADIADGVWRD